VPANETAGLDPGQATDIALKEAARITIDHGYRYFTILPIGNVAQKTPALTVIPGTPVRFQLLKTKHGETGRVWDAYTILRSHSLAR
jgi:hypothetical protein